MDISIRESDRRIDTLRASGAGGQHVNVTDSAVVDRSVVVSTELEALRNQGVRLMFDDFGAFPQMMSS